MRLVRTANPSLPTGIVSVLLLNLFLSLPALACSTYALNDKQLNLSQLLCIDSEQSTLTLLQEYSTADLEGIALHPESGLLYLISSSDAEGFPVGELYRYSPKSDMLKSIGNTGYPAIDSLAFCGSTLYGWARGTGLVEVDTETAVTQLVFAATDDVEGLTCDNDGTLYGAYDRQLLMYDGNEVFLGCELPATTETLEVLEQNSLLLGLHNAAEILQLDLQSCTTRRFIETGRYRDIEGLAVQTPQCIRLEDFAAGQSVEGQDTLYPGLTIAGVQGSDIRVVKERRKPMLYTSLHNSNNINNLCLGKKKTGFGDLNRKHRYTFSFDKPIKYFSLWMHDYGDYNKVLATRHAIFLEGFDANQQLVAADILRYKTPRDLSSGIDLADNSQMGRLTVAGEACRAKIGQIGNSIWSVSGAGMTEVVLRFDNNVTAGIPSDPNFAISALCFTFDDQVYDQ